MNYLGVLDQQELAEVYASADVFVFPSKTDTFGLVLLEAMACGLPVAAYPVTGPLDVIGDSKAASCTRTCARPASRARAQARGRGGARTDVLLARGDGTVPGRFVPARARRCLGQRGGLTR